jgi:hypothetical protein
VYGARGRTGPCSVQGRMGLGLGKRLGLGLGFGMGHGARPKATREGGRRTAPVAIWYLLRWRWANNSLALPSAIKAHHALLLTADISAATTDPTCLIAEHDGAPLGAREDTPPHTRSYLACQRRTSCFKREFMGCTQNCPPFAKCVHGTGRKKILAKSLALCVRLFMHLLVTAKWVAQNGVSSD